MSPGTAIIWGTRTISYQRLEQYISSVIKHLRGRGIETGDRVAIIEPNSIEYVIVLLSLWRMGAVACPLNPHWPYETHIQCLSQLKAKLILTHQRAFHTGKKLSIPVLNLKEIISFDARIIEKELTIDMPLDNEATVIWTSGSSQQPKAAVHTWGNHYYSALGSQETIPLTQDDKWVLSLPLYHVSGISIICRCYLAHAAIVIAGDEDLDNLIRRSKPTHVSMVSTQLYRLLENKDNHELLRSIKYILLGGSAMPASLLVRAKELDLNIFLSYGLTETASQVATGRLIDVDKPCAKVLPHRQLKIDEKGQILVKGEVLFKGYIQGLKIHLPLTPEGWFETKDRGQIEDGYLTVLGRMDNMFICAGENIQPEEIENVLMHSPQVKDAVVVPRVDREYGHVPIAFVKMTVPFNEQYLINFCLQSLPKLKVPVTFYPWPQDLAQGLKISRQFFQERVGRL